MKSKLFLRLAVEDPEILIFHGALLGALLGIVDNTDICTIVDMYWHRRLRVARLLED